MSFTHSRDFTICGVVVRKYAANTGGFASLTIESTRDRKTVKHDCKAFDRAIVEAINGLGAGMTVELTGSVGVEKLTNKDKSVVKRDGYDAWVPMLIVTEVKVEGSSVAAGEREEEPPVDLSEIPF